MKKKFITQSFGARSITIPSNSVPVIIANAPFDEAVAMTINFLRCGCPGVQLNMPSGGTVGTAKVNLSIIQSQLFSLATDEEFVELHSDDSTCITIVTLKKKTDNQ